MRWRTGVAASVAKSLSAEVTIRTSDLSSWVHRPQQHDVTLPRRKSHIIQRWCVKRILGENIHNELRRLTIRLWLSMMKCVVVRKEVHRDDLSLFGITRIGWE